jgi:hypothetical protein
MSDQKIREIEVPGLPRSLRAKEVEFEAVHEGWNEYKLADGTLVRVKNVVLKIFIQVDEDGNPTHNETRDLNVVIAGQNLVVSKSTQG